MKLISLLILFAAASLANAQYGPGVFNFDGTLLDNAGQPITQANVAFKFEILDAANTCVVYSEQHNVDLSATAGAFSVKIGTGSAKTNYVLGTSTLTPSLFVNMGPTGPFTGCAAGVTMAPGDARNLRVSYDLGSGFQLMTPNFALTSVPAAFTADMLNGKTVSDLVQIRSDASNALTQPNMEFAFSSVNWPRLQALLNGNSTQYLPSGGTSPVSFGGQRLTTIADPVAAQDAATRNYADNSIGGRAIDLTSVGSGFGDGRVLAWDASLNRWSTMPPAAGGFNQNGNSFGTTATLGTNDAFALALRTANTTRMTLTSAGKVGVGTTAPAAVLAAQGVGTNPVMSGGTDAANIFRVDNGTNALDMGVSTAWTSAWMQARMSSINGTIANLMLQPYGGSVAIGMNSAPGNSAMFFVKNNGAPDTMLVDGGTSGSLLTLMSGGVPRAVFMANGFVGIGTTSPSTSLQVAGVISPSADNTFTLGTSGLRYTSIYATNGTIQTSDAREKKDVADSDLGLAFITRLRPVSYRWRRGPDASVHYGLIAQETEKVVGGRDVIVAHDTETDRYGIKYTELIAPLIKAMQELHAENAELKRRLEALESR